MCRLLDADCQARLKIQLFLVLIADGARYESTLFGYQSVEAFNEIGYEKLRGGAIHRVFCYEGA